MAIDPDRKAQIEAQSRAQSGAQIQDKAQVGALLFDKASTEVPAEYSNYSNVFSAENVVELPKNTGMNEHAIELEEGKQPPFGLIYSLGPVELETLKTYIEITWPTASSGHSSPPPELLFSLIGSQMEASAFAWIIRALTTSLLKTDIRCL